MYVVLFEDNPSIQTDIRKKHMPEHLSFLEERSSRFIAAGPLKPTEKNENSAGMWIVDAERESDVRALINEDPFWPTGLRKSYRIFEWTRVFADGRRLI